MGDSDVPMEPVEFNDGEVHVGLGPDSAKTGSHGQQVVIVINSQQPK